MPNIKNYPKGFSPYSKPFCRLIKPEEYLTTTTRVSEKRYKSYDDYDDAIHIFNENGEPVKIEVDTSYDCDVDIIVYQEKTETTINPDYTKLLESYKKAHDIYKKELKEWTILSTRWKAEEKEEQIQYRKNNTNC